MKLDRRIVSLNNLAVKVRRKRTTPDGLLLLFPSCLQHSECKQNIRHDLSNCKRCGRCKVKDMLEVGDTYGIACAIATGGLLALQAVKKENVSAVVAIACEKELREGILAALPKAVIGVVNMRPHGPCKDTDVNMAEVRKAVEWFLR